MELTHGLFEDLDQTKYLTEKAIDAGYFLIHKKDVLALDGSQDATIVRPDWYELRVHWSSRGRDYGVVSAVWFVEPTREQVMVAAVGDFQQR